MNSPAPAPSPFPRYNGVSCFHSVPCACHCPDDKYAPSDPLLQKDPPADESDPERLMPVPGCEHTFTKWIDHKRSADRLLDPGL